MKSMNVKAMILEVPYKLINPCSLCMLFMSEANVSSVDVAGMNGMGGMGDLSMGFGAGATSIGEGGGATMEGMPSMMGGGMQLPGGMAGAAGMQMPGGMEGVPMGMPMGGGAGGSQRGALMSKQFIEGGEGVYLDSFIENGNRQRVFTLSKAYYSSDLI